MTDKERLLEILNVPIYPHENVDPLEAVADYLLDNGVTFANDNNDGCKWIPVSERLPVDWCPVLVMVRDVGRPLLGSYRENVWFHENWNTTFINGAVTHWMPLPEPPKGG